MALFPLPTDFLFKFLVIGSAGTGKSCLLHQFIENKCRFYPRRNKEDKFVIKKSLEKLNEWQRSVIGPQITASVMELLVTCLSVPPPPHSQTRLQPHHRRGVRLPGGQRGREDGQTADLGHCGPGAISVTASGIFRNRFWTRNYHQAWRLCRDFQVRLL